VNLSRILSDGAAAHGENTALWFEGRPISYSELDGAARAAERVLAERGVGPGDRVAVKLSNSPAYVAVLFGALRRGAIVVPINVLLAPPEIDDRIASSTPATLVDEELPRDVGPTGVTVPREGSDPAVILYTSGTSGRPKGAILTHGGILAAARNAADALALGPEDVVLGAAPFSHVLGQSTGIVSTLLAGAAVSIVGRFEPERTLATMTDTRTTILLGVPTMCIALCQAARAARELPPLRIAHVGGAAVPEGVARDFEQTFGGDVVEGYGLTELSGLATTFPVGRPRKPGSVGVPLGGTEMRIREADGHGVGEVLFRGPSVIPGYWNDTEATASAIDADGWLATGDMGRVDEDGDLYLVDRKKEVIIRGGYNVYPREVEEALYAHPDVLEAAVVGVPDATLGEEVGALVVRRPGAVVTADELEAWSRERVARYKVPRRIVFVDDLPRGPTGKILKRAIDRTALTGG
jgi:long-chain acyl-CoA synthetase